MSILIKIRVHSLFWKMKYVEKHKNIRSRSETKYFHVLAKESTKLASVPCDSLRSGILS